MYIYIYIYSSVYCSCCCCYEHYSTNFDCRFSLAPTQTRINWRWSPATIYQTYWHRRINKLVKITLDKSPQVRYKNTSITINTHTPGQLRPQTVVYNCQIRIAFGELVTRKTKNNNNCYFMPRGQLVICYNNMMHSEYLTNCTLS